MVLATSIAETSLTIEGVRIVVDSGLARRPRYEPALGLTRLETVRASQAAITQRAGRAGRLEPGVCWRLWSEGETRALPEFDRPEILDADLSGLALDLAAWGVRDPASLAWLDPPPKPAWSEALAMLTRVGALDAAGALDRARPRARAAAVAAAPGAHGASGRGEDAALAARIAVLLTEQGLGGRGADLRERLHRFAGERGQRADAARRLADRIADRASSDAPANVDPSTNARGAVLALAFPDRVAKRRGAAFLMANGRAASMDAAEPLSQAPYLVIADIAGAAGRAQVLLAAPIEAAEIEAMFAREIRNACGRDDRRRHRRRARQAHAKAWAHRVERSAAGAPERRGLARRAA